MILNSFFNGYFVRENRENKESRPTRKTTRPIPIPIPAPPSPLPIITTNFEIAVCIKSNEDNGDQDNISN